MKAYQAQIAHTENTIRTLMKIQDRLCHPILNYIGGAGCVTLVILSIMLQPQIGKVNTAIFSFLGCMFFITNRHRPRQLAEDILGKLQGKMPVIRYEFNQAGIVVKRETSQETIPYNQITGLAENRSYCFFVYQKKAAFMLDKKTVEKLPELKEFLKEKTAQKKWVNLEMLYKKKVI